MGNKETKGSKVAFGIIEEFYITYSFNTWDGLKDSGLIMIVDEDTKGDVIFIFTKIVPDTDILVYI